MRFISFCICLLALYVVSAAQPATTYCRGSIEFQKGLFTSSTNRNGKIEKRALSTEDCADVLQSIGISKEMIEYISYEEQIVDGTVIVRGMHSSSIAQIQHQLVGEALGIAAGTLSSAFFGLATMVGFLVFPPMGLVYGLFLLVSGSATLSSGIGREQQIAMLGLLQTNVLQVDTKALQISQERQSFHLHFDLPIMVANNQSFSPLEQYCTWKQFTSMELQTIQYLEVRGSQHTAQWIVNTSVFRPIILDHLSKNQQLAQATRTLLINWSKLYVHYLMNQESSDRWKQLDQFWDEIRNQIKMLTEDPFTAQCTETLHLLQNNLQPKEENEAYNNQYWKLFQEQIVQPDSFCILVKKGIVKLRESPKKPLLITPGHVACFITNPDRSIDSTYSVTLHPDKLLEEDKVLSDLVSQPRSTIRFLSIKDDMMNLFKLAKATQVPSRRYEHYLAQIPLPQFNVRDLQHSILQTNTNLANEKYAICRGTLNGVEIEELNCVTGFYNSANVIGSVVNPSPQMSLWSFLNHYFGFEIKTELIKNSNLQGENGERTDDDQLTIRNKSLSIREPAVTRKASVHGRRNFSTLMHTLDSLYSKHSTPVTSNLNFNAFERIHPLPEQSNVIKRGWTTFSPQEKKDIAIRFDFPGDAEVAYYKGLGFSDLGSEYITAAIIGFEQAIKLDSKKYKKVATAKMQQLKRRLELEQTQLSV